MLLRSFGCCLKLDWIKDFSEEVGGVDEAGEEDKAGKLLAYPLLQLQSIETHVD